MAKMGLKSLRRNPTKPIKCDNCKCNRYTKCNCKHATLDSSTQVRKYGRINAKQFSFLGPPSY